MSKNDSENWTLKDKKLEEKKCYISRKRFWFGVSSASSKKASISENSDQQKGFFKNGNNISRERSMLKNDRKTSASKHSF